MEKVLGVIWLILAGMAELGGCYLVWLARKENKGLTFAIIGAMILILYGFIPTLQKMSFGRVNTAYAGVFLVMSVLWGWVIDKSAPDKGDIIGALVALLGTMIIVYWPR